MLTTIFISSLLFAASACTNKHHRIINGNQARIDDYPFMVSILAQSRRMCGGSIIARSAVLTAAHCMDISLSQMIQTYRLKVGYTFSIDGDPEQKTYRIIDAVPHEDFSSETLINDIGILLIEGEFEFSSKVRMIKFARENNLEAGNTATIMGWGSTERRDARKTSINTPLQYAKILLISNEECQKLYGDKEEITDLQFCADGGRKQIDTCQGDSGGPVLVHNRVAGIVSWGYGCADPEYPGVYTRVSTFADWIDERIGKTTPDAVERIVNGDTYDIIEEYPFMVSLRMGNTHFCGGAIISLDAVLTAAHCLQAGDLVIFETVTVLAGHSESLDGDTSHREYKVSKYFNHFNYDADSYGSDVAVLLIKRPFQFSNKIKPVRFASKDFKVNDSDVATIIGWDRIAPSMRASGTSKLRVANAPIIENAKCQDMYRLVEKKIMEHQLCTGGGRRAIDTCKGDSGGPLIVKGTVVGIISWGWGCTNSDYPGVYTRVSTFANWIEDHLQ